MAHCYNYTIAQLHTAPARGERLNLALLVFNANDLHVHVAKSLDKLRAISAALDKAAVNQALTNLKVLDQNLVTDGILSIHERVAALSSLSPVKFSDFGKFFARDADSYDEAVERLLTQLVEPEPAPRRTAPSKKTKLLTSIKSALRSEKILARRGEGLDSHRIIANQELATGLNADLLLKNGAMHVIQSVDASHIDRARKAIQEIGVSALVFEQARIKFGERHTSPRLIYSASAQLERALNPALNAAQHQGAELINWDSHDQRARFVVDMTSLAEPSGGQSSVNFGPIQGESWRFRESK